ncbi:MAG: hypothetical protein MRJ93_14840 [Nitrososphaeraceae archaeon]|nr:hypothetical protein [Nitrososphaeraceae archaeon]
MKYKYPIPYPTEIYTYCTFRYQVVHKILFNFKNFLTDFKKYVLNDGQKTISSIFDSNLNISNSPQYKYLINSNAMTFNPKNITKLESKIEKSRQALLNNGSFRKITGSA